MFKSVFFVEPASWHPITMNGNLQNTICINNESTSKATRRKHRKQASKQHRQLLAEWREDDEVRTQLACDDHSRKLPNTMAIAKIATTTVVSDHIAASNHPVCASAKPDSPAYVIIAGGVADVDRQTRGFAVDTPVIASTAEPVCVEHREDGFESTLLDEKDGGCLSSVGAAGHASGNCRPCAWFRRPTGCINGHDCKFCHTCPEGALKKKRRDKTMFLKMADACNTAISKDGNIVYI
eukprot:TRINITY_DN56783_c0_g1_i1.p1 TRINITY_DN56783_c0_g1~~TRINITY_DN56783_c0_g1_i1.p1  ORF type:complete len:259 (+),score=40.92 TRINITY_DN56783_c0_g1_i1:64-777(+)